MKVVTAEEMARTETGGDIERFMEEAGRQVALAAIEYVTKHHLPKQVTLLVGKGNNGGDAYAAGVYLLREGFEVHAFPMTEKGSPLNRKFRERFERQGGKAARKLEGLILDGLLGTGCQGAVEGPLAELIQQANGSGLPILAIDLPSGLNATTGEVGSIAIIAKETIALGFLKLGFFLKEGWNHVGRLRVVDFGLSKEAVVRAEPAAYVPKRLQLPKLVRNRHKYQTGYLIGFGGSKRLSGAVKLAGMAALKAGAGMVRLFHPEPIGSAAEELICNEWNQKGWSEALEKAQAVFVGPGLGRSKARLSWLRSQLKKINKPCVIDADALLPHLPFPKEAILTPHRGEAVRLFGWKKAPREEELLAQVAQFSNEKHVIVILKGAPTWIFTPYGKPVIVPRGDPGMAKAGTGDVLTGILGALLAQGCSPEEAAVLGVTLHAIAGEKAAEAKTSYCVLASDLIDFMPAAFRALMAGCDIV